MTNELEVLREKLNKCSFSMGLYTGALIGIVDNIPDRGEFDDLKQQLNNVLSRLKHDIEHLFYGVTL